MGWYRGLVKPAIDFAFAFIVLCIGWPVLTLIFLVNRMVFTTALFVQERIGQNEEIFKCFKFRSMKTAGDETSIPPWGKFLRFSSLDELPQAINILRGEMSLVGPRPLLPEYLPHYTEEQRKRHIVKPGITGLAQVKGRNTLSWEESLRLDAMYAERITFWLDLKIIVLTIPQVFKFGQVQQRENTSRTAFNKPNKE
jgi:undecaprenyl phosphate N,N'-diacetylbacillosamine 1-phosphate transferase